MRYFYDTEFLENGDTIELISIGMVAEDGRSLYRVSSDMPLDRIKDNDWLVRNVLSYLPLTSRAVLDQYLRSSPNVHPRPSIDFVSIDRTHSDVRPLWVIANEVRDFIAEGGADRDDNELWAYYGAYDHVALCQLWGTMMQLPAAVPMFTHELMQLWNAAGRPDKPEQGAEHHALADAEWSRALWLACHAA